MEKYLYYREVPNSNNTAVGVALLTKKLKSLTYLDYSNYVYQIIQATILELEMTGNISIIEKDNEKINIKINDCPINHLKKTQRMILEYIKKLVGEQQEIEINELKRQIKQNKKLFKQTFSRAFVTTAIEEQKELGNCTKENKKYDEYIRDFIKTLPFSTVIEMVFLYSLFDLTLIHIYDLVEIIIGGISLIWLFGCIILQIKIAINMIKRWKKIEVDKQNPDYDDFYMNIYVLLTDKGFEEQRKWELFKKYLKEYTLIKDYDIKSLEINKEILVYATLFGIADNVKDKLGKYGPLMIYWD